ncbi:unnamed protein product [Agarophyton chilense]
MTTFVNINAIGASALFPPSFTSFQGCKLYNTSFSHNSRRTSRSRIAVTPQCSDSFNYNIYQDGDDRSKRVVSDSDRSVVLQKPLGMVLEEGQDGMVFVAEIDPDGNAAASGEVNEGDVLVAVSATFGDEVWSTRGVGLDRVMKSIRIRSGDFVTLVLESPDKLSEMKTKAAEQAASRRSEARDKFGEREVLDPVTWTKAKPQTNDVYEYGDPEQPQIDDALKQKLKREVAAPYEQNWILWIGAGILILVLLSVAFGLTNHVGVSLGVAIFNIGFYDIPTASLKCRHASYIFLRNQRKRYIFFTTKATQRRYYFQNTHRVIFVVDSNDRERFPEAREELNKTMVKDELENTVLLVFTNKQDLPNAASTAGIVKALGLPELRSQPWYIMSCFATNEAGLHEGVDRLANKLKDV